MMPSSQEWMPREQWDALVRGQGCPACAEVTSSEQANEQGFFVADLDFSRLRLAANQFVSRCPSTLRPRCEMPHNRPLSVSAHGGAS